MTTEGTDAYYSPVPGPAAPPWGSPPPTPWASPDPTARFYPPPPPPTPWPAHRSPASATSGKREKRGWGPLIAVAAVVAVLALILAGGIGGARYLGGSKRVSDDQDRVSISVPRTWTGTTEEEYAGDGYTPPVLEFSDFSYDNAVRVYVEPSAVGATPADEHRDLVDDLCDDLECVNPGQPTPVQIDGHPGLQTVVEGTYGTNVVITVISGPWLISLEGETSAHAPDPDIDRLTRIAQALSISV